jgi:hypothetical protein
MEPTTLEAAIPLEQPAAAAVPSEQTDIFAWANNLFMYKDKLKVELFLLNKSNMLYRTNYAEGLGRQLHALFIDAILEYVITGAGGAWF